MDFVSSHPALDLVMLLQTRIRLGPEATVGILACVGVFVAVILVIVFSSVRSTFAAAAATAQLATTGVPALGRIVSVRDLGGSIKSSGHLPQQRLQIDLEVDMQNGQPIYRASAIQLISMLHIGRLQPGAVVPIKYDPANPVRVALVL